MKAFNVRDAIFEALLHRFAIDPTMVAFGEENRDWGGAFAVYRGLTEALPYHRLFNAPISEAAIVGAAVGYALEGGRVVAELMYADFIGRAGDEIFNQLSKWQAMSAGELTMPVVLRISVGAKYGAQHSQDWTALLAHIPGLKVVYPVTPYDAKGMMNAALAGTDPVVFFESQKVYDFGEMFVEAGVPEGYYEIDLAEPSVKRAGSDLTIVTLRPGALHGGEGGRRARQPVRHRRGDDRPALGQSVELRATSGVGAQDRQGAAGLRRGRARVDHADRRGEPDAALLRRPGRAPRGARVPQLDHPGAGTGSHVLPAARVADRRDPRADPTTEGPHPNHEPVPGRTMPAAPAWESRDRGDRRDVPGFLEPGNVPSVPSVPRGA